MIVLKQRVHEHVTVGKHWKYLCKSVMYGAPKGTHVEEKIKLNRAHDL